MSRIQIELKDANRRKLVDLASRTGRTQDEIVNDAMEQFAPSSANEAQLVEADRFRAWREALLEMEGVWAERDDLPDFSQLRNTWNRDAWGR